MAQSNDQRPSGQGDTAGDTDHQQCQRGGDGNNTARAPKGSGCAKARFTPWQRGQPNAPGEQRKDLDTE